MIYFWNAIVWLAAYLIATILIYLLFFNFNAITARLVGKVTPNLKYLVDNEDQPEPVLSIIIGFFTTYLMANLFKYYNLKIEFISIILLFLPVLYRIFKFKFNFIFIIQLVIISIGAYLFLLNKLFLI